jgi:O-antigen ligase
MLIPVGISLMSFSRNVFAKLIVLGVMTIMIWTIYKTFSRAGLAALVLVVVSYGIISKHRMLAAGMLLLVLVAGLVLFGEQFQARLSQTSEVELQGGGRVWIWKLAFRMIAERPLFGYGINCFKWRAFELGHVDAGGMAWIDTHNSFLRVASEIGIPGMIAFAALIGTSVRDGIKIRRKLPDLAGPEGDMRRLATGILLGVLGTVFVTMFHDLHTHWFIYIFIAFTACLKRMAATHIQEHEMNRTRSSGDSATAESFKGSWRELIPH